MNTFRDGDEHKNEEQLARVAIEMYQKDQERQLAEKSMQDALQEMEVPEEYLERARAELYRRNVEQQASQIQARKTRMLTLAAVMVLAVFLGPLLATLLRPARPFTLGFANIPQTWAFEQNDGTIARLQPLIIDGKRVARIKVSQFAPSRNSIYRGDYWAQARTTNGPFDMRKLNEVTFRARGEGLSTLRLRFKSADDEWITPAIGLGKDWQEYKINLNTLTRSKIERNQYIPIGEGRIGDKIDSAQVQVGEYINPVDSYGTVDVDDLNFR
ncbi:MAG: hypothetical protein QOJ65_1150 [Fimbriimonadaceae bacterium]|jgi:hypothetical protein|nr:hypothetical protein [Fimbriimonadaceae bacterium]